MVKSKIALSVFAIAAVLHLASIQLDILELNTYTKPLLMISLLAYFLVNTSKAEHPTYGLIIGAIVFAWLGDVFLMFQQKNPMYFMFGLGAFLISHVFYILSYRKLRTEGGDNQLSKPRLARYDFFLLLICLTLITVLRSHLGDMLIPVIVYAITITYMTITAVHRYGKTSVSSFWMVMLGAALFMISDSTIALNKFVEPIPNARLIIMTTYITAQYLIIQGLIKHVKS